MEFRSQLRLQRMRMILLQETLKNNKTKKVSWADIVIYVRTVLYCSK